MREPKVLFIYPPNQLMPVETPRPDGSLGFLYLAGSLRLMGIEADIVDATVGTKEDSLDDTFYRGELQPNGLTRIGMTWKRLEEFLGKSQYDIVGINSNFTPQTKMAFRVAEIAKKVKPETLVIAGGVNARNLWPRFIKTGSFDLICTTEGEKPIREIVRRFIQRSGYEGIAGTIYFHEGKPRISQAKPDTTFTDLDELPLPTWEKLPFEKYESIASPHGVDLTGKHHRYAPLMTSRGCPFQCSYCHISLERFGRSELSGDIGELRLKSVPRVLQEIETLRALGVKKIFVEDDSLLAKKPRIKEIFTAILEHGLTIADVNGVNLVHFFQRTANGTLEPDREYMELLYNSGFQQIVFPVESGSQRILDKYATAKLKLAAMDVVKLTQIAADIGIICPVNMMIGFPDETEEEMMKSVDMARRLIDAGAPYVTFFIPIPFPGSELYNIALRGGHLDPDFDPDIMNWKNGVMQNTIVPVERTVEIRDWAWSDVNPPEHVAKRLQESIGHRWQPGTPGKN